MKKVRILLLSLFWSIVSVALLMVVVFETELLEPGIASGDPTQGEVILTYIVELATIALIPTALRLFKFHRVDADLRGHHEEALRKWGVLRLLIFGVILLFNTLFYYVFMNTSFGYLAIMTALCLPFVYPSEEKCQVEAFVDANADVEEKI